MIPDLRGIVKNADFIPLAGRRGNHLLKRQIRKLSASY
jgi:hypothetical protein